MKGKRKGSVKLLSRKREPRRERGGVSEMLCGKTLRTVASYGSPWANEELLLRQAVHEISAGDTYAVDAGCIAVADAVARAGYPGDGVRLCCGHCSPRMRIGRKCDDAWPEKNTMWMLPVRRLVDDQMDF